MGDVEDDAVDFEFSGGIEGFEDDGSTVVHRKRVKKKRIGGRIVEWRGPAKFGWIHPDMPINHPEATLNKGRVYVHAKDVVLEAAESLKEGDQVVFLVYADGKGLGAMDCRLRSEVTKPKVKKPKLAEDVAKVTGGVKPKALNHFASDGSFLEQMRLMQVAETENENVAETAEGEVMSELESLLQAQEQKSDPWSDVATSSTSTQWSAGATGDMGKGGKDGKTWQAFSADGNDSWTGASDSWNGSWAMSHGEKGGSDAWNGSWNSMDGGEKGCKGFGKGCLALMSACLSMMSDKGGKFGSGGKGKGAYDFGDTWSAGAKGIGDQGSWNAMSKGGNAWGKQGNSYWGSDSSGEWGKGF